MGDAYPKERSRQKRISISYHHSISSFDCFGCFPLQRWSDNSPYFSITESYCVSYRLYFEFSQCGYIVGRLFKEILFIRFSPQEIIIKNECSKFYERGNLITIEISLCNSQDLLAAISSPVCPDYETHHRKIVFISQLWIDKVSSNESCRLVYKMNLFFMPRILVRFESSK